MNPMSLDLMALKWLACGAIVAGVALATLTAAADQTGIARVSLQRYATGLERELRRSFVWTSGNQIALGQALGAFFVAMIGILLAAPAVLVVALIVVIALGPTWHVRSLRKKRVQEIDAQLDGFILALANALKSTPSVGDAFQSIQSLLPNPLRQEIELAVREMRIGSTLQEALLNMGRRVGSETLDTALASILIGREVGGSLPLVLETMASTMREMARLEEVIKSKTAEGKAQLWVLASLPFVMMFLLGLVSPGYFDPLTQTATGYVVTAVALFMWLLSIAAARQILSVNV